MRLFGIILAVFAFVTTVSACDCTKRGPICITEEQMASQVLHLEMSPDRMGSHVNGSGILLMEVTLDTNGRVVNAKLIFGQPIATALLFDAVPRWRFKPLMSDGAARGACGRLRLRFSIVENKTSVGVATASDFHDCDLDRYKPIRVSDYFTAPANVLETAKPSYPPNLVANGIQGNVAVRILIDLRTGAVEKACAYSGPVELRSVAEGAAAKFRFRIPKGEPNAYALDFLMFKFVLPK